MILELHRQGLPVSAIARRTGVDRKTVRKYIKAGLEPPHYGPRRPRPTLLDAHHAYLRERVAAFPDLSARRLMREMRGFGYAGGYSQLTEFLRQVRPAASAGFERRFETPPGKQAQVDFAQFRTEFTDEPGTTRIVWLFSMVLGHSRLIWATFVMHQDLQAVLRCHVAAFEALGGVPAEILYDRMRTVVTGEGDEGVVYNATLLACARHYGFLPRACRPYRAKSKGKVERPFRYVRQDFFLARSFRNLEDLNQQLRRWLDEDANARVHATTRRVVAAHFAAERPSLKPLPAGPFQAVLRPGTTRHPRRHDIRRRQSLQRARLHPQARRRGAHPDPGGAHLRGGPADRRPPRAGGTRPAPDRRRPSAAPPTRQQRNTPGKPRPCRCARATSSHGGRSRSMPPSDNGWPKEAST